MTRQMSPRKKATVLAVTSGKGGVGKTNLAINVSVALARLGHRVAVVDADFGLGNVDVMLGLTPNAHVGHILSGEKSLREVLIDGPRGLSIVPAGSGLQPLTALTTPQRERLTSAVEQARGSFDFLVLDTATGISDNVIETLKLAEHVLLMTSLDPSALVDAYALAKVLWQESSNAEIGLVVNGVRDDVEARLAFRQIDLAAARFLGHHLHYFGFIPEDPAVRESMLIQRPIVDHLPQSPAARCFRLLATRLATLSVGRGGLRLLGSPAVAKGTDASDVFTVFDQAIAAVRAGDESGMSNAVDGLNRAIDRVTALQRRRRVAPLHRRRRPAAAGERARVRRARVVARRRQAVTDGLSEMTTPLSTSAGAVVAPSSDGANEEQDIVCFPRGIPGFESCRGFAMFKAEAAPFEWLTAVEGPAASFLTVDPRLVLPNYRFALSKNDLAGLGADDSTPLLWLAIVILEADGTVAANLRAPIVINPATMLGQQVMPQDCLYPLRHVIVSASET